MEFLDDALLPVDAKYYAIDVDNGNRQADFTPAGQPLIASSGDFIYTNTASSGTAQEVIITQIVGPDDTAAYIDNRGISGGADVLWRAIDYNNNIATYQPSLDGLGEKSVTAILPTDSLISETTKATTDAYTELETAQKFYDRAKAYLVDNYAGETVTTITRTGDTVDAGSYDIDIDATAASVFAFDGSTITIKASTFTGNLTTTGTVTLSNGATVVGTIIDSTADSSLTFSGIDSWIVYANTTDRDANTNVLGSGTGSENFRFNYVPATTYYMRLIISGEIIFKDVTPVAAGETAVSLGTAALLTGINATTATIDTKLGFIEKSGIY